MNQCECFSNVTQTYLNDFERILNNMIRQIDRARMTNSISRNFINQMIPHHEAAIAMSKNILRYTTDLELQCLAEEIIRQQTQGIATMRRLANVCGMQTNCREDLNRYQEEMNRIMCDMFDGMRDAVKVNDVNENFLREMIPHHLGAVAMSENALRYCICSQLIPVLENIISTQKREVEQMRKMLGEDCGCAREQERSCGCQQNRGQARDCECQQNRGQARDCECQQNRNCECESERQQQECDRDREPEQSCGCQQNRMQERGCGCQNRQ